MFDFEVALRRGANQTILCIGDLMLDEFVYGEVMRISPEAPAAVLAVKRSEVVLGGAGNVARNVTALGARCIIVGIVGNDDAGRMLSDAFAEFRGMVQPHLIVDKSRPTTRKVRFVSEHHSTHMLRADWEMPKPVSSEIESLLVSHATSAIQNANAVVLSDYAKGVLTPRVIAAVIEAARRDGKPIIVDPKAANYAVYRGATLITPNRKELGDATHLAIAGDSEIAAAAAKLARIVECEAVLVTRSEEGMTLHVNGHVPVHVPAYPVRVRDVSGAGDTVAAVSAILLSVGADFESAVRAANAAAAVVVAKHATATVTVDELRHRILPAARLAPEDKIIFDWSMLDERIREWRRQGLRIGFTNGCFDLLHPGHVKLLAEARAACDRLVVGLNSDNSTSRLKGVSRPIQPVEARAEVLAALEAVDLVVVFEQNTPIELIKQIQPTVLVKGGDYTIDEVVGRAFVEAQGGAVVIVDLVPSYSTSEIVRRSQKGAIFCEAISIQTPTE